MKISLFLFLSLASSCLALSLRSKAIQVMAQGINVLKPVFSAEAKLQAAVLGSKVDSSALAQELEAMKKKNKVLIYTYGLSPFSTEALSILESTGCDFTNVELGVEWFLLGGKESTTRVLLSKEVESGATSLPKIFINGKCIGGCAELSTLADSGELEALLKKAGALKKGQGKKAFGFF